MGIKIKELGHVVLFVHDLDKMKDFYSRVLGFPIVGENAGMAAFSSGRTHHEMLLIRVGAKPKPKSAPEPGLYHIGFKIGDDDATLKKAIKELEKNNIEITGFGDHHVSHSLYIHDPEGNELELYVDVSDEWKTNPEAVIRPTRALKLD